MRAFSILSGLTALCMALAAPSRCLSEMDCSPVGLSARNTCVAEMCGSPAPAVLKRVPSIPSKASVYGPLSNGERLARGLPLKAPSRRIAARVSSPSATPTYTVKGKLLARRADNGDVVGYVSTKTAATAYFFDTNADAALLVSITLPVGETSGSQLNVAQLNGPNSYPYLGLVQGRDSTSADISPGSFNYLYFSGTDETLSGAPPQKVNNLPSTSIGNARASESAVWNIDIVAGTAVATWINTDGNAATTQLFSQSSAFYAGGDPGAFRARYPSPVTGLTITWVTVE